MKKIISIVLIFVMTVCSSAVAFAQIDETTIVKNKDKINALLPEKTSMKSILKIEKEIECLSGIGINMDSIKEITMTDAGTEFALVCGDETEYLIIKDMDGKSLTFDVKSDEKHDQIFIDSNGTLFLDDHKVVFSEELSNNEVDTRGVVWKGTKSLKPYSGLTASDYDDFLTSKKQNADLGKALDNMTATALATCISYFHGYVGIAVSLLTVAKSVYDALVLVNPKTKNLGCIASIYTSGAFDYKYINRFYANSNCTGTYRTELSYEHFIVY